MTRSRRFLAIPQAYANGRIAETRDALGNTTRMEYDSKDRKIKEIDPTRPRTFMMPRAGAPAVPMRSVASAATCMTLPVR
jgi:YD repeat-containing protein